MVAMIPKNMRAVVKNEEKGTSSVQQVPVPTLENNDVLVKIEFVAQNPTDWKHSAFNLGQPGSILGCDFSGEVVSLGANLKTPLQIGDKVAGCVHGGLFDTKGSYAEYARAESDLVFKVPEGVSLEESSVFGVAWVTACQALISSQGKDWPPAKVAEDTWYLIYGASSSVGLFAVQLAVRMGYKVIAVCSSHNHSLVKSLGATEVLDYSDGAKTSEEIKKISGGGITIGLDTISEGKSWEISLNGFKAEGGRLNGILPPNQEAQDLAKEKKVELQNTLMYTLFGREFTFAGTPFPPLPADREFMVEINKRTPALMTQYGIKANPVDSREGLDNVFQGWEDLKNGKVSGKKLVYKIA